MQRAEADGPERPPSGLTPTGHWLITVFAVVTVVTVVMALGLHLQGILHLVTGPGCPAVDGRSGRPHAGSDIKTELTRNTLLSLPPRFFFSELSM